MVCFVIITYRCETSSLVWNARYSIIVYNYKIILFVAVLSVMKWRLVIRFWWWRACNSSEATTMYTSLWFSSMRIGFSITGSWSCQSRTLLAQFFYIFASILIVSLVLWCLLPIFASLTTVRAPTRSGFFSWLRSFIFGWDTTISHI